VIESVMRVHGGLRERDRGVQYAQSANCAYRRITFLVPADRRSPALGQTQPAPQQQAPTGAAVLPGITVTAPRARGTADRCRIRAAHLGRDAERAPGRRPGDGYWTVAGAESSPKSLGRKVEGQQYFLRGFQPRTTAPIFAIWLDGMPINNAQSRPMPRGLCRTSIPGSPELVVRACWWRKGGRNWARKANCRFGRLAASGLCRPAGERTWWLGTAGSIGLLARAWRRPCGG